MRLSTRSTYGMRALVELGLSMGRGPLSAALIARQQNLSIAYLEQLLHRLKVDGLLRSVRGPKGGYLLAKDPGETTVAEVVRALDGRASMEDGGARDSHRREQRIAHAVFRCVHERLAKSLDHVTLQDLCDEVREGSRKQWGRFYFSREPSSPEK